MQIRYQLEWKATYGNKCRIDCARTKTLNRTKFNYFLHKQQVIKWILVKKKPREINSKILKRQHPTTISTQANFYYSRLCNTDFLILHFLKGNCILNNEWASCTKRKSNLNLQSGWIVFPKLSPLDIQQPGSEIFHTETRNISPQMFIKTFQNIYTKSSLMLTANNDTKFQWPISDIVVTSIMLCKLTAHL